MTNHDDVSRAVAAEEAALRVTLRGDAELDHKHGKVDDPLDGIDSETIASFNLKRIRKALGLSQQQIADRIASERLGGGKLSQTQIAKIERGERPWRLNDMMMISGALGVHWNEFFQMGPDVDYTLLDIEAARLRYEQAKALEDDARNAWSDAAARAYEAEGEYLKAAASAGHRDAHVDFALEMRHMHQAYVSRQEQENGINWDGVEERTKAAKQYAEREWKRLVEEAAAEAETEDSP